MATRCRAGKWLYEICPSQWFTAASINRYISTEQIEIFLMLKAERLIFRNSRSLSNNYSFQIKTAQQTVWSLKSVNLVLRSTQCLTTIAQILWHRITATIVWYDSRLSCDTIVAVIRCDGHCPSENGNELQAIQVFWQHMFGQVKRRERSELSHLISC